jgi:hypothetical protein
VRRVDPRFTNLLACLRIGRAWNGTTAMTADQLGQGTNYKISDYDVLHRQRLQQLKLTPIGLVNFCDVPIIVSLKTVWDTLNV